METVKTHLKQWSAQVMLWLWLHTFDLLAVGITDPNRARRYHNNVGDILSRSCGKWLYSAKGVATKGKQVPTDYTITKKQAMWMLCVHTVTFIFNTGDYNKEEPIVKEVKVGVNDPCPCDSGRKYKKCCRNNTNNTNNHRSAA